jgi:hypothetical protein
MIDRPYFAVCLHLGTWGHMSAYTNCFRSVIWVVRGLSSLGVFKSNILAVLDLSPFQHLENVNRALVVNFVYQLNMVL